MKRFWVVGSLCPFLRLSREYNKTAVTQILKTSTRKVKYCVILFSPVNRKTSRVEDGCMTSFRNNYYQNYCAFWEGWRVAVAFLHFVYRNAQWIQKDWIVLGIPLTAQVTVHLLLYLQKWITKTRCVCQNCPCDLNI